MCNFSINFNGDAQSIINRAETAITNAGGSFERTSDTTGNFSIHTHAGIIVGNYTVVDQAFQIVITQKPFLVSCNRIEEELRRQIGG